LATGIASKGGCGEGERKAYTSQDEGLQASLLRWMSANEPFTEDKALSGAGRKERLLGTRTA